MRPEEVELLRRSIAMRSPGTRDALDREVAMELLGRLRDLERMVGELRRLLDELGGPTTQ